MSWFRQNRFLGAFLVVFGAALIGSLLFLWLARSSLAEARARFDENAAELNRLQQLTPFPNEANLRKMKAHAEEYSSQLNKAKEEMLTHVLPATPMAPNEFQARLRQAMSSVAQKARENRVKLPDNFNLGFDEFVAALPDTAAAPSLGQQLAQVELLVNLLIDARIDALTSLRRVAALDPRAAASATPSAGAARKPAQSAGPSLVERASVDATFVSSPAAARRALNQITTIGQQFYVIRTLHILNEKEKGPPRESAVAAGVSPATSAAVAAGVSPANSAAVAAGVSPANSAAVAAGVSPANSRNAAGTAATTGPGTAAATGGTAAPSNTALTFIVGNEHIQTAARIEMLRFTF